MCQAQNRQSFYSKSEITNDLNIGPSKTDVATNKAMEQTVNASKIRTDFDFTDTTGRSSDLFLHNHALIPVYMSSFRLTLSAIETQQTHKFIICLL